MSFTIGVEHDHDAQILGRDAAFAMRTYLAIASSSQPPAPRARTLHLVEHDIDVDHVEIDVGLAGGIGINRREVIRSAHLHAVTGVIEHRDVGALNFAPERLHRIVECALIEIGSGIASDQNKAQLLQRPRH